jgi:hypothetical protein
MKETETDLLQMLEAIRVPLMLSDPEGTVLAQNRLWVGARSLLREGELERTIREAASSGQEAHLERERLNLSAVPLPGPELRVLVQLSTDEVQTELRAQLEDTVKTTASYQEKLSHFGTQNYIATSDRMIRIFTKAKQVAAYPHHHFAAGGDGRGQGGGGLLHPPQQRPGGQALHQDQLQRHPRAADGVRALRL